jgi:hypothetical protein
MTVIHEEIDATASIIIRSLLELKYYGEIDVEICQDIADHWERDVKKLESSQQSGIAIEKLIGYYAFWVRKLQPVTKAHPFIDNNKGGITIIEEKSNTHINELVAIYLIKILAVRYFNDKISEQKSLKTKEAASNVADYEQYISGVEKHFSDLFSSINSPELYRSFLNVCLYDMRYRTFGPHHFTHAVRFLMFNSGVDLKVVNSKLSSIRPNEAAISKRILKLTLFLSAPKDMQDGYFYEDEKSHVKLKKIIKDKNDEWIERYRTTVVCIAQKDVPAQLSESSSQEVVNSYLAARGVDAYCGFLKHAFGTPTKAGFGSGTEEEYNLAIKSINHEFILFGTSTEQPDYNSMDAKIRKKAIANTGKISKFKKQYGDKQFFFDWNDGNLESVFTKNIEALIVRFCAKYS